MKSFTFFTFLSRGNKTLFDIPVDEQLAFLQKLGVPRNDIERSYFQYLSQQLFIAKSKNLTLNLASSILMPFLIIYLFAKRIFVNKGMNVEAIGEFKGIEEVLPVQLSELYDVDNNLWRDGFSLCTSDISFLIPIFWRHQPYFALKSLLKVAQYSHSIKLHAPQAILVHNEYSFTSSLLTAYCERNNMKHINAMHGEKLLYIRDSFFRYHECYVWDVHYANLFTKLKADPTQFRIAIPPSMSIDCKNHINKGVFAEYKYYLANNTEAEIIAIADKMHEIKEKGHSIKVRLHPRYSNTKMILNHFNDNEIEYPQNVNIIDSISNLDYAIGSYSTVLVQAYLSGKNVVMDDVALKEQYIKLSNLDYILSQKNSLKLSEI